jgi:GNAT superfamily N-acetyltransferase
MTATELNPAWHDPAAYIEFLNSCFPEQWDRATYDWYIGRPFNGRSCDILVRSEGNRILAGLALCYRQLSMPGGELIEVCVLCAGGTVPDARGQGHYPVLLQQALQRCRERRCVAALGFVRSDNASGRGLARFGARAIPSFYISSPAREAPSRECRSALRPTIIQRSSAEALLRHTAAHVPKFPAIGFNYARAEDWRRQFLERPHPVEAVRLAHDSAALVERVGATDRLQLLNCPEHRLIRVVASLVRASQRASRHFFMYSLNAQHAALARRLGLRIRAGQLLVQDTGFDSKRWTDLVSARWSVQAGDRS